MFSDLGDKCISFSSVNFIFCKNIFFLSVKHFSQNVNMIFFFNQPKNAILRAKQMSELLILFFFQEKIENKNAI